MRRKRIKEQRTAPAWLVKLLVRERIFRWRVSTRLRRWAAGVAPARLRWYCFFFLLAGCLAYTWILVTAVTRPGKGLAPSSITLPAAITNARQKKMEGPPMFRRYLDSVNADPVLKKSFDSLRAVRPGFADTIRQLEELIPDR